MRVVVAALSILAIATTARAQPGSSDEAPVAELMTFGVGEVVFEKFGHAAICLRYQDPARDTTCFNFGVTDFSEGPSMIWSFLRGVQEFWVEPLSYAGMLAFYEAEDRDIYVQTLPLTEAQSRKLEHDLYVALDGPGSHYHYDHFFDNCSTRLRDVIDDVSGGKLSVDRADDYPLTFRELGHRGLAGLPPLIVLSDFVGGSQLEDHPTLWQAMFHPDILRREVERRLGAAPRQIYGRRGPPFPVDGPTGRWQMLAFGLLFALPLVAARARRHLRLAIAVVYVLVLAYALHDLMPALWGGLGVFGLGVPLIFAGVFGLSTVGRDGETFALSWVALELGVWGVVVWGLMAISPIAMLRWNEVALVVAPFDLLLPFLGPRKRRIYARGRLAIVVLASLLCAIGVLVQPLWVPILVVFMPLAPIAFDLPRSLSIR